MVPIAITIAKVAGADTTVSNKRVRVRTITLDNSYPTGGYTINPADVGLSNSIEHVNGAVARATAAGATAVTVAFNYATGKLQVYTTASAEAANLSDQSAFSVRLQFWGS